MRTLVIGGTHRRKLVSNILWCRTWSGFFFRLRFDLFLIIFRFLCFVWPKISKMLNLYVIKLTAYLWKKNCCFWNLKKKPSHLKKKIKKKSVKKVPLEILDPPILLRCVGMLFCVQCQFTCKVFNRALGSDESSLSSAVYKLYIYIGSSTLKRVKRKWHQFYQAGHFTFVL